MQLRNKDRILRIPMAVAAFMLLCTIPIAKADSITLEPDRDNTLFESLAGSLSNGVGDYFYSGMNGRFFIRRGLLRFDIDGVLPAGSTVNSVTLQLHCSRSISGPLDSTLHRLLSDWGEGASNSTVMGGGGGAPAEPGDATWLHTFYDTSFWVVMGGEFDPTISGATMVAGFGFYTWDSTPGMVADVQAWLDDPAGNFGWLVRGDESVSATAKRFDSREITAPTNRPQLTIDYTPAFPPGDMNCDGRLDGGDIDPFFLALGDPAAYLERFPNCDPLNGDMNGDGRLDGGDIDLFFLCLGGGGCP